ncbi:MAG: hypothetical protein ACO3A2_08695 [Bdellovibrionia bacterium]
MIRAAIDLGTQTCLLLIAQVDPKTRTVIRTLCDEATVVRLGEGVDEKRELQPAAMARVLECLKHYARRLESLNLDLKATVCVATSQARDARNTNLFFERIQKEVGFSFRTLSGQQEAAFTFLGSRPPGVDPGSLAILDIGGGSTELITHQSSESLDVGSVRFTERFFKSNPVQNHEFQAAQQAIDQQLSALQFIRRDLSPEAELIGVAGTVTTLASWHLNLRQFDAELINTVTLSPREIQSQVEQLKKLTLEERRQLPGVHPLRADVLLAGALILWRTLEVLGFQRVRASTRGLRYGLVLDF